jgi:hypothetical protein
MKQRFIILAALAIIWFNLPAHAETGYDLWLRYKAVNDPALKARYIGYFKQVYFRQRQIV